MTRTHRFLTAAGLGLAVVAGASACSTQNTAHRPIDDVNTGWTCQTGADGFARSVGSVTNHSSKPSFYLLTVEFGVDGRLAKRATGSLEELAPGATARLEVVGDQVPAGELSCRVAEVERLRA
jgi:hypothetical protein